MMHRWVIAPTHATPDRIGYSHEPPYYIAESSKECSSPQNVPGFREYKVRIGLAIDSFGFDLLCSDLNLCEFASPT